MAVLSDNDRAAVTAEFQRNPIHISNGGGAISKADLRAAVNAADQWAEDNASSFNTAIPQPARSAMSLKQKTLLLSQVILKRAGLL